MATINPSQDYDVISTFTFTQASGQINLYRFYRGSASAYNGTGYYRAGTSGAWTSFSNPNNTKINVTDTVMQVAHDWNKSGNSYMTLSFQDTTNQYLDKIEISQKAVLSGGMGTYFMYQYATNCSSLTTLNLPAAGYFKNNNIDWSVPSGRLGYLKGYVSGSATDLSDWKGLTTSGKTLYTNYIQDPDDVLPVGPPPSTYLFQQSGRGLRQSNGRGIILNI